MKTSRVVMRFAAALPVLVGLVVTPAASAQVCAATDASGRCLCPAPGQTGTCNANLLGVAPHAPLLPALQPKFVNRLPVPVYYEPVEVAGFDYYEIAMKEVLHPPVAFPQPLPGAPAIPPGSQWVGLVDALGQPVYTPAWGYAQTNNPAFALNGVATWPSMSFRATKGKPVKVMWKNEAPDQHLFCKDPTSSDVPCAIDRTLMGTTLDVNLDGVVSGPAEVVNPFGGPMQPDNAMVVHLHGGEIPPDSDGMAELWIGNSRTAQLYGPSPDPACTVAGTADAAGNPLPCGAYYQGSYNVVDQAGTALPVLADILPHFTPPPNNGIPRYDPAAVPPVNEYPALNFDGATGAYQPSQLMRPTGAQIMYNYPNVQEAATIWYHDHALGKTRVNVAAGPAGFYVIRDPEVEGPLYASGALPPEGDCSNGGILADRCFDIPIAFQDRAFNADGSVNFPNGLGHANAAVVGWNYLLPGAIPNIHPQWVPEYFGDVPVVNGVAWPRLPVEARPYRFRVLGGSNARCWSLTLKNADPLLLTKPPMYVIATEQGYLSNAVAVSRLTFCPGERYDVVIDFSGLAGQSMFVSNDAPAPFPNGENPRQAGIFQFIGQVMRFDIGPASADPPAAPYWAGLPLGNNKPVPGKALVRVPRPGTPGGPVATPGIAPKEFILNEVLDPLGVPVRVQIEGKPFEAPVTETPRRGTTEVWKFLNTTVDAHPIHLHLVKFQVVERQKFSATAYATAAGVPNLFAPPPGFTGLTHPPLGGFLLGKPFAPALWEQGWKDTVIAYPGEVTTVVATWDGKWNDCASTSVPNPGADGFGGTCRYPAPDAIAPYFEPPTAGPYVWHCHIVDHEDNEMMRPALVLP